MIAGLISLIIVDWMCEDVCKENGIRAAFITKIRSSKKEFFCCSKFVLRKSQSAPKQKSVKCKTSAIKAALKS
jgi:hypothetical protein